MKQENKSFREQDFSQQSFQEAIFENCQFYLCNFSHADLRDAQFINCKFIEAGENTGCQFDYADVGVDLTPHVCDPSHHRETDTQGPQVSLTWTTPVDC